MFFGFANFQRRFIKGFSKITASLILILKITVPLTLARPFYTKANRNEFNINGGSSISSGSIDDRIINLSNCIKKISFKIGFLIFKASLANIQLKKPFIKAPILYYFDPKYYI